MTEPALQQTSRQDIARVSLLAKLGKLYIYKDARQAVRYTGESVRLSEGLGMRPDAMTYLYMARAYGRIPDNENAQSYFKTALSVASVQKDTATLAYKIPTMLIQPYVENAITHGLMNKENGKGFLHVELQMQNDQIICTIKDNGIGRAKAMEIKQQKNNHHQSMGTNITESRLKLVNELYGKSMKVVYTDLMDDSGEPAGTKVEINIPIIT